MRLSNFMGDVRVREKSDNFRWKVELCHMNYHKITHHNVKAFQFSYCSAGSYFPNIHDWYSSQSSFINGCSSVVLHIYIYIWCITSTHPVYSPWFPRMLFITLGRFEAFTTEIMNMNWCFPWCYRNISFYGSKGLRQLSVIIARQFVFNIFYWLGEKRYVTLKKIKS